MKSVEHLALKPKTLRFRLDSRPRIGDRLGPVALTFRIEIKLGMIGVVGDGARVPEGGMLPGPFADDESRFFPPGLHAAAPALPNDADVAADELEL